MKSKILIVDDVPQNIKVISNMISNESTAIVFTLKGKEAVEIAEREKVDLILLDVVMPEMNGFEVCRRLKANSATKHIPVIFFTSKNDENSMEEGFEAGAVDYISKPFYESEIKARVKTQIELKNAKDELRIANEKLVAANRSLEEKMVQLKECCIR